MIYKQTEWGIRIQHEADTYPTLNTLVYFNVDYTFIKNIHNSKWITPR